MSHSAVRMLKFNARKYVRRAALILPIFLCGCFDSQHKTKQFLQSNESGISSIGRFFTFYRGASSTKAIEKTNGAFFSTYSFDSAYFPVSAWDSIEEIIALPDFVAAGRESSEDASKSGRLSEAAFGRSERDQSTSFRSAVSLVFNSPFSRIFSSVFEQSTNFGKSEILDSEKAEEQNPFTEALLKQKASPNDDGADAKETVAQKNSDSQDLSDHSAKEKNSIKTTDTSSGAASLVHAGFQSDSFLILGDFEGSGVLQAKSARRSGDKYFVSADGVRTFNLYVNPDAVARPSSFYIDDINMDGKADFLVSRVDWLMGAVMLGDGAGGYKTGGRFITAYSAILPCAGPIRNGMKQIMTVSADFGLIRTFQYTDKFQLIQTEYLSFVPEYLLHLVATDSALDFVMAARIDGTQQMLGWRSDGFMEPVPDTLDVDATVLRGDTDTYSLRAFQTGDYVSIVLTSRGASFNVANMRLMPGTYIAIGDFGRKGTLDVAVAGLESFLPAQ